MEEKILHIKDGLCFWTEFLYSKQRGIVIQRNGGDTVYIWPSIGENSIREMEERLLKEPNRFQKQEIVVESSILDKLIAFVKDMESKEQMVRKMNFSSVEFFNSMLEEKEKESCT